MNTLCTILNGMWIGAWNFQLPRGLALFRVVKRCQCDSWFVMQDFRIKVCSFVYLFFSLFMKENVLNLDL